MRTLNSILEEYRGKKVFLIDNLWYMHKCYSVMSDFQNADGYKTGHLYGMANLITNITTNFEDALILICEDCGSFDRKQLDESYKANRHQMFSFHSLFSFERNLFQDVPNVFFCYSEGFEADDVLFSVSRIKDYNNEFIIFSGDNDLLQALDDSTKIVRKIVGDRFTIEINQGDNYYNKTYESLLPSQIPVFRAIVGDKSDNLQPIIYRFPRKVAKLFAKNYDSQSDDGVSELSEKERNLYNQIPLCDKFHNNLDIMRLKPVDCSIRDKDYKYTSRDVAGYLQLFKFRDYLIKRGW